MNLIGRLLYISGYRLDGNDASTEHVREICFHLADLGWHVTLIGIAKDFTKIDYYDSISKRYKIIPIQGLQKSERLSAFALWQVVSRSLAEQKFDVAYIRPARKTFFALQKLRQKGIPYVVEVNTNLAGEHRAMGSSFLTIALADLIERRQLSRAAGAFCVTQELAEYVRDRLPRHAPTWITGNGFCAKSTTLATFNPELREALGITEQENVVTFLASLQPWHGADLLLEALRHLPESRLWIIGDGPEKAKLQALATQIGVQERVHWWGYQEGDMLQQLLGASDIAVGSLALYRNNMYEAQPLKVRHYLGVGLPTIIGYNDTMLSNQSPGVFYAQTPDEIVVRVQEIQRSGQMRDIEYRQKIREFALENLSWAAIARQTSDILSDWLVSRHKDPKLLD